MNRENLEVPLKKLRYTCNPQTLRLKDASEVEPARGFIGQERAVEAIRFGLEITDKEHNIFATGNTGKGKKRGVLCEFLENFAREKTTSRGAPLKDACYIHNFEAPDQPRIVFFEKGGGRKFKKQMETVLKELKRGIPALFQSEEYALKKDKILAELENERRRLLDFLAEQAKEAGLVFSQLPTGYSILPAMPKEEYDNLPAEKKKLSAKKRRSFEKLVQKTFEEIQYLKVETQQMMVDLEQLLLGELLESVFGNLCQEYAGFPKILDYFERLKECILDNYVNMFDMFDPPEKTEINIFLPFSVNLFIDNSLRETVPVVFESNPSFSNLFCKIEKRFITGAYFTDHTCLKAGSLCLANGGYLILNAMDILENGGVWQKLKKTLRQGVLEIEEPLSFPNIVSLNPEPFPVHLKVIVVGEPYLYELLSEYDPDFLALFKVKVEFDSEMPLTNDSKNSYAGFISYCCREGNLLSFDSRGVAKIVEEGCRLAGSQQKLSTKFDEIKDLVIESDYWAKKSGSSVVSSEHVRKAREAQRLRLNLTEQKLQEFVKDEMLLIATRGEKVGQINGLVVYNFRDYSFGMPIRITAKTFQGKNGVISIDREVKMSGPIHDKGVRIFSGYFNAEYGKYRTISFSASICFEQSYSKVEGDSASPAELFCLISSLSDLPIKQSIAVTGSVNQNGELQPIGGVNEKIEGFFDICQKQGLTGEQGVIIPHQNTQNLMLREDVVGACQEGKFRVYAIKTVNEGVELLMKLSADAVDRKVRDRLREMAERERRIGK